MADDIFRGWLTGVITEDATDTSRPVGHRAALVQWCREDSGVGTGAGAVQKLGVARVMMPNGALCPVYAASLHLFGTLSTPPTFTIANAPRVLVRRDVTATSGGSEIVCHHVVISPSFVARLVQKWGSTTVDVAPGEYGELTFFDPQGNTASSKVGHVPNYTLALGADTKLKCGSLVIATLLTNLGVSPPVGTHAWSIEPCREPPSLVAPVRIVSGTGASYIINVFANGPLAAATLTNVPCTQLQIAGTETIPANTWTFGMYVGGSWYTQVPVWL